MDKELHFPSEAQIEELLEMLIGRRVNLRKGRRRQDLYGSPAVGLYVLDDGSPCAAMLCDLPFAVRAGAALALVPSRSADELIRERRLDELGEESLHEVLNVAASLFNAPNKAHVRLEELSLKPKPIPPAAVEALEPARRRLDLKVEIVGYGLGSLTLLAAA